MLKSWLSKLRSPRPLAVSPTVTVPEGWHVRVSNDGAGITWVGGDEESSPIVMVRVLADELADELAYAMLAELAAETAQDVSLAEEIVELPSGLRAGRLVSKEHVEEHGLVVHELAIIPLPDQGHHVRIDAITPEEQWPGTHEAFTEAGESLRLGDNGFPAAPRDYDLVLLTKARISELLDGARWRWKAIFQGLVRQESSTVSEGDCRLEVLLDTDPQQPDSTFRWQRFDVVRRSSTNDPELEQLESTEIETQSTVTLEPVRFTFPPQLEVELVSLAWDDLRFDLKGTVESWQPLEAWAELWLGVNDDTADGTDLRNLAEALHRVDRPLPYDGGWRVDMDFGSAPIEAFWSLLATFSRMGFRQVWVSASNEGLS